MAKKKKKKRIKKLHEGRVPLPQQRCEAFKDKRKKRDKQWRKRLRPDECE